MKSKIIAVVATKGGVGKSTIAVNLAAHLARMGDTLLVDGDRQESAASWAVWRKEGGHEFSPTTIRLPGRAIADEGKNLFSKYDYTVIDAGGRDNPALRAAMVVSDVLIVPIGASSIDAAAMDDFVRILEDAKAVKPEINVKVVLSRIDTRTKDRAEMLKYLHDSGLEVLDSVIHERVIYRRVFSEGMGVFENSKDPAAKSEVEKLFTELEDKV